MTYIYTPKSLWMFPTTVLLMFQYLLKVLGVKGVSQLILVSVLLFHVILGSLRLLCFV